MSINIASEIVHFAGHTASPPAPPPSRSTRHGLSGIECRPVQRVLHGLPCIWHGLRCCLCCAVRPGALSAGVSTGGAYSRRPAPPGECRDKIFQRKRRFSEFVLLTPTPPSQNETYLVVQVSKFSEKYKKAPFGA